MKPGKRLCLLGFFRFRRSYVSYEAFTTPKARLAMNGVGRCDILFSSNRFNLSEPREYFINDCCFGDDVAGWLVEQLRRRGWTATEPDQEDWGWYIDTGKGESAYFVGIGGTPDDGSESHSNHGEWRLMVEKHRTLWEKLTGANGLREDEEVINVLKDIVAREPGLAFVGIE
jgi:hypothetical protein